MVENITVARPYAKAIFEVARDTACMPWWSGILSVLSAMVQEPGIRCLIKDKSVSQSILEKTLLDLCGQWLSLQAQNFLKLLILNRRLSLLPDIATLYETMCLASKQRLRVYYETSIALTTAEKEKTTQVLSQYFNKTVELDSQINESLLGGYRAQAGSVVIDASIVGYLDYLKGANV
ncbi:MAG: F0F1 ATP synthase subunit delta [Gammaproteobacteria bacterium]|nr:F0F1 ATP synthase subunit delta [Gammaproteobacteria bacterium]MBP9728740.1 F0F1 ATP synthase subunit delta [Gammaproteobacteria bacterium]